MSERAPNLSTIRHAWAKAHPFPLTTDVEERYAEFDRFIAAHDAEKRAEWEAEQGKGEPKVTSIKPFHQPVPGMPDLFHTYCAEHPEFGTCAEEAQAHRDIADHLEAKHSVPASPTREENP